MIYSFTAVFNWALESKQNCPVGFGLVGALEGLTVGIPVGEWLGETLNKEIGKRIVKIHAATDTDTHSGLRIWNARDRHEKF